MPIIQAKTGVSKILIGRQGENLACCIQFNLSQWQAEFGPGRPALIHKRCGDRIAYPVDLRIEGAAAYWDVTDTDTEIPGRGKCELSYYVGDVIAKSITYTTEVIPSMNSEIGYKPQALPGWVDIINTAAAGADQAAGEAKEAAGEARENAQKALEAAEAANQAAESYEIPAASKDSLGGIRIGSGLTVAEDGTASVDSAAVADMIQEYAATDEEVAAMLDEVFGPAPGQTPNPEQDPVLDT